MTSNHSDWNEEGVPRVILIRVHSEESSGGLLSDERVGSDELDNLDIVSILTEEEETIETSDPKQQGVNRVVEALRSFQVRRLAEKEAQQSSGVPDTPKSIKQQRFFASRQKSPQNSLIPQASASHVKREKGLMRTPDTMNTTPEKSLQKDGDEKGIASLRRFLNFGKGKQATPLVEPGLASMGEEDTVQ